MNQHSMTPSIRLELQQVQRRHSSRIKRDELIRLGQVMSNVLFNVKESKEFPAWFREKAKELHEKWDATRRKS